MTLHFLRHAEAEASATRDFDRALTSKGRGQAQRVGRFCESVGLAPNLLLTSPVVRARQTADLFAGCFSGLVVREALWLACGMRPEICARELSELGPVNSLFLVGHEPDFGETIAWFLGAPSDSLHIRKASLTGLDVSAFQKGSARLEYSIPARFIPPSL